MPDLRAAIQDDPTADPMPAPLLFQLIARLRGQQPAPWTVGDYAMGLTGGRRLAQNTTNTVIPKVRQWVGSRLGPENGPRTLHWSYTHPTTTVLPDLSAQEAASQLQRLLLELGGGS